MSSPSPGNERLILLRWGLLALLGLLGWMALSGRLMPINRLPSQLQAGENALKARNPVKAAQQFDAVLKAAPPEPDLYLAICQACREQKQLDLAIHYGEQALVACQDAPRPDRAQLYVVLSDLYSEV